jgi:hypothetical protein
MAPLLALTENVNTNVLLSCFSLLAVHRSLVVKKHDLPPTGKVKTLACDRPEKSGVVISLGSLLSLDRAKQKHFKFSNALHFWAALTKILQF